MAFDDYNVSTHIFQAFHAEEYEVGDNFSAAHEVAGFHVDASNKAQAFAGCLNLNKIKRYLRIVMTLAVRDSDVGVIMVLQPKDSRLSTTMSFSV
jgi:hypothetical protein